MRLPAFLEPLRPVRGPAPTLSYNEALSVAVEVVRVWPIVVGGQGPSVETTADLVQLVLRKARAVQAAKQENAGG